MRQPTEFNVGGTQYRATRMDVKTQLNVIRRLTPLVTGMIEPLIAQMKATALRNQAIQSATDTVVPPKKTSILDVDISALLPGVSATATLLAKMDDAEFGYIQTACLALVEKERGEGTGWVKIWNRSADQPQFDDLEGQEIILIMVEVLKAELGPFMRGALSSMSGGLSL